MIQREEAILLLGILNHGNVRDDCSNAGENQPDAGYRSKPTGNVAERSDLTE